MKRHRWSPLLWTAWALVPVALVVIFFNPDIAAQFLKEFERVYQVAEKVAAP